MGKKKIIEDREELERLAPMLKAPIKRQVFVCTGKSCSKVGAPEVMSEFDRILKALWPDRSQARYLPSPYDPLSFHLLSLHCLLALIKATSGGGTPSSKLNSIKN